MYFSFEPFQRQDDFKMQYKIVYTFNNLLKSDYKRKND